MSDRADWLFQIQEFWFDQGCAAFGRGDMVAHVEARAWHAITVACWKLEIQGLP